MNLHDVPVSSSVIEGAGRLFWSLREQYAWLPAFDEIANSDEETKPGGLVSESSGFSQACNPAVVDGSYPPRSFRENRAGSRGSVKRQIDARTLAGVWVSKRLRREQPSS